jgi:hypothetical protein
MYKIVLYNNGKKVKTFRAYNLYSNAIKKYRDMLKNNNVFFPKQFLWNGTKTDYELVLTAPAQNKSKEFFRNEMGAMVKIVPKGDFSIKQIEDYLIEDTFKNKIDNKKYNFKTLIKKILNVKDLTYTLIVINNKLVVERFENEDLDVFVLKNREIAYQLFEAIKSFNNANNLSNFIYFEDPTLDTRMRIYETLEEKYNISKFYMQKISTH